MKLDRGQTKRLQKVLLLTGGVMLALLGYALFVNFMGFGLPCMYQQMFHIECAGCGLSRAAAAILRLDFKAALGYNAVWPLYLGYVLWAVPAVAIPYVKDGRPVGLPKPLWLNWVVLAAILAYGFGRNFI